MGQKVTIIPNKMQKLGDFSWLFDNYKHKYCIVVKELLVKIVGRQLIIIFFIFILLY